MEMGLGWFGTFIGVLDGWKVKGDGDEVRVGGK